MMTPVPTLTPLCDPGASPTPQDRDQACLRLASLLTTQWPTTTWTVSLLRREDAPPTARPMAVLVQWSGHGLLPADLTDFVRLLWIGLLPGELLGQAGFCATPRQGLDVRTAPYSHFLLLSYPEVL